MCMVLKIINNLLSLCFLVCVLLGVWQQHGRSLYQETRKADRAFFKTTGTNLRTNDFPGCSCIKLHNHAITHNTHRLHLLTSQIYWQAWLLDHVIYAHVATLNFIFADLRKKRGQLTELRSHGERWSGMGRRR